MPLRVPAVEWRGGALPSLEMGPPLIANRAVTPKGTSDAAPRGKGAASEGRSGSGGSACRTLLAPSGGAISRARADRVFDVAVGGRRSPGAVCCVLVDNDAEDPGVAGMDRRRCLHGASVRQRQLISPID